MCFLPSYLPSAQWKAAAILGEAAQGGADTQSAKTLQTTTPTCDLVCFKWFTAWHLLFFRSSKTNKGSAVRSMKPIFISCSYEHKSAGLGWIAGKPNFPLRLIDHGLAWHDMWRKFDHFPRFSTLAFSVIVIFHNSRTVSIFFPSLPALPYSKISLFFVEKFRRTQILPQKIT